MQIYVYMLFSICAYSIHHELICFIYMLDALYGVVVTLLYVLWKAFVTPQVLGGVISGHAVCSIRYCKGNGHFI